VIDLDWRHSIREESAIPESRFDVPASLVDIAAQAGLHPYWRKSFGEVLREYVAERDDHRAAAIDEAMAVRVADYEEAPSPRALAAARVDQ
jgi:hypothetical protein